MRRALLIALVAGLALAPAAQAAKQPEPFFEVGAAKVGADPPGPICLGGYGGCPASGSGGRWSQGIKDPLYSRALAIGDDKGGSFILVHTTNIGLFASYKTIAETGAYWIRQRVAQRTGVPAGHVVVQADHSHSGPDTIGIWGGIPTSYLTQLQDAAVQAAVDAWSARRPANVFVGVSNDHTGVTSSYEQSPNDEVDDEFRMLWANDGKGSRIATWSNYSPHATVLGSGNKLASGDWPEWASQMAEKRWGGTGLGSVGTLGREDFGAEQDGDAGMAEARARLKEMMSAANKARQRIPATGVGVRTTFLREPIGQPILLANLAPEGASQNAAGYDISIDRDVAPPWITGTMLGTFAGAVRIGDVFVGVAPGESFPELQGYLRDEGGVTGARAHFHLGASNDFLGYMLRPLDHYPQVAMEGALFLGGCPEETVLDFASVPYDGACPDHWTLMVSPTIGSHVACTIQAAALDMGFTAARTEETCPGLTATDGASAPAERSGNRRRRAARRR